MSVKKMMVLFTVFVVILLPTMSVYAGSDDLFCEAYAQDEEVDIYVKGKLNEENLSCKVSNKTADILSSGNLADAGVAVRTTILVDISTSVPYEMRETLKRFIATLIEQLGGGEQYRLIVFGEEVVVLQDFTTDRYDLASANDKIEFNGQQSKIYDAVYNTIPDTSPIDGNPCYYRTIVLTDGIDDTASGITKEELYIRLQSDAYPVDVVSVSVLEKTEPEKELAALTRMSGGRNFNLHQNTNLKVLSQAESVSDVYWVRAKLPSEVLDGSTRQFDLSDGTISVQFDYKVPMCEMPETTETLEQTTLSTTEASENTSILEDGAVGDKCEKEQEAEKSQLPLSNIFGKYTVAVYILFGVIVLVLVIILVITGKKRKDKQVKYQIPAEIADNDYDKTELVDVESESVGASDVGIRLRNVVDPDQIWELSLKQSITIGRDRNAEVSINEKSISRYQCKIYLKGSNEILAENLSESNITQLNGKELTSAHLLTESDRLKFGRITLIVDSIYGMNAKESDRDSINKMTKFANV